MKVTHQDIFDIENKLGFSKCCIDNLNSAVKLSMELIKKNEDKQ
jgi:hypothetical protein